MFCRNGRIFFNALKNGQLKLGQMGIFRGSLLQEAVRPYLPYLDCCNRIITDNITPAGERFSRRYGFRCIGSSAHSSRLYIQTFADFVRRVSGSL